MVIGMTNANIDGEHQVWPGDPYPLGSTYDGAGTNFALFSDIADKVEAEVRANLYKLMGGPARPAAKAAEKAVAVSADDFNDED